MAVISMQCIGTYPAGEGGKLPARRTLNHLPYAPTVHLHCINQNSAKSLQEVGMDVCGLGSG